MLVYHVVGILIRHRQVALYCLVHRLELLELVHEAKGLNWIIRPLRF